MNCPKCKITMKPVAKVDCKTGDAIKHKCPRCNGIFFQDQADSYRYTAPLNQTLRSITALASL